MALVEIAPISPPMRARARRPFGLWVLACAAALSACSSDGDTENAAGGGEGGSTAGSPAMGGGGAAAEGGSVGTSGEGGTGGGGGSSVDAGPPPPIDVTPPEPGTRHTMLSDWHLFEDIEAQTPMPRVVPYMVNSILFSDYATKHRFMWIPEGTTIAYDDTQKWGFPVGTILVKTFTYLDDIREPGGPRRLLETRLLHHEAEGVWKPHTYVYEDSQSDAVRKSAGDTLDASWTHFDGETRTNAYGVPENNVCEKCHGAAEELNTLGGRTRQLNRDFDYESGTENQIDHLFSLGMLDVEPPPVVDRETLVDPSGTASVSDRARSYLDANCGHCHGTSQLASGSGFLLDWENTDPIADDPTNWGVCKVPASAGNGSCGLTFDVVPGDPDQSIIVCRIESRELDIQMPPLASKLAHDEGATLIREWITGMQGTCN